MTSKELKRLLESEGCTFAPGKGGHLRVMRGKNLSVLPMHGSNHELGKGLVQKIRKQLGLKALSQS